MTQPPGPPTGPAPGPDIIHPVILCGGSGTRLWPLSRKSFPKQFSALLPGGSLFQGSARRCRGTGFAPPLVVTNADFRFIVREQLDGAGCAAEAILIEPEGRNTAPAVLAAALHVGAMAGDALVLVAPSDHVIPDDAGFRAAVRAAAPAARAGQIVTFGIAPDRPETGYGYLELAAPLGPQEASPLPLRAFVEKPEAARAVAMLSGGCHLWNAGIFLFSVDTLVAAFAAHAPAILSGVRAALDGAEGDLGFTRLAPGPWAALPDISIDYAVMEKAANLSVMPWRGAWSDLGGWDAVWREGGPDAQGVVRHGAATAIDCTDTLLRSEAGGLALVGIGLRNLVAVAMPDAVLIADKDRAQEVKLAVSALKAQGARQAEVFPRDHRPWGWFETLALGERFQVKRIVVHPGGTLSLQSHHHRSEHWIVVQGTARVTIGDEVRLVSENQSIYVPLGARHRMENPGKLDMVLIEVQTGSYLGEDDIIRHEDIYARK
ncbi:MAG: mannose-1-phosphate guanylyltransferase/mannose-6-phosphate isomerase [Gemmobacter sp.]